MPEDYSGSIVGGKAKSKQFGSGRTCTEDGCDATLSTYNPGDKCSPHKSSPVRTSAGNVRRSLGKVPVNARSKNTRRT